jgi:hypothetical protein
MDRKLKGNTHRDELVEARNELAEMFAYREQLEFEIAKQQRRIAALTALVNEGQEVDELLEMNLGGMTEAVRSVFRASNDYGLTPVEIRDRLVALYFPVNEYKNFLASLHSVLGRLEKNGEIKPVIVDRTNGRDESVYQWITKHALSERLRGRFSKSRFESRFKKKNDF